MSSGFHTGGGGGGGRASPEVVIFLILKSLLVTIFRAQKPLHPQSTYITFYNFLGEYTGPGIYARIIAAPPDVLNE